MAKLVSASPNQVQYSPLAPLAVPVRSFKIPDMPLDLIAPYVTDEPRIETERLQLRPFRLADFEAYAAYHVKPDTYRFLYAASPDRSTLRRQFTADIRPVFAAEGDTFKLAVVVKETGQLVGEVILRLAYVFNSAYAGHGYATEATQAIIDYGFDHLGLHRIAARIDAHNTGSIRVIERLKFRKEAHFLQRVIYNGIWCDELVYAMLAHEWPKKRPSLGSNNAV
jgi:RimJ/RimL family protein N-acetyltransferase